MKIDITTTKTHRAVITADQLKTVALAAVKKDAKVADGVETADKVDFGQDGSITVEVTEPVVASDIGVDVDAETDAAPAAVPATPVVPAPTPSVAGL